jgi:signal peptidase I
MRETVKEQRSPLQEQEEVLTVATGKKKSAVREYIEVIGTAVLLALFIRTFVVQAFKIPSGSMKPTLLVGDHILVNKFIYGIKIPFTDRTLVSVTTPKRGDVIVFKFPRDTSKDYIKRVIGLPGDQIQLIDRRLLVNGKPVDDPHAFYSLSGIMPNSFLRHFGPITVPADHLFVMGDNRDESSDSRVWGFVPMPYVLGKAFLIYWSWDQSHIDVRWRRLGHVVN